MQLLLNYIIQKSVLITHVIHSNVTSSIKSQLRLKVMCGIMPVIKWDQLKCITVGLILLFWGWDHCNCLVSSKRQNAEMASKFLFLFLWHSENLNCCLELPKTYQIRVNHWTTRNKHIASSWKTTLYIKNLKFLRQKTVSLSNIFPVYFFNSNRG